MIILAVDIVIGTIYGIVTYLVASWLFSPKIGIISGVALAITVILGLLVMQSAAIGGDKYDTGK